MTDHTPAEIAAAHRVLADDEDRRRDNLGLSGPAPMAEWHRKEADELDPPKPTWPDGMYAIVTFEQRFDERALASYARRAGDEWVTADGRKVCDDDDVTKVEPLRALGDDEIAVKRVGTSGAKFIRMQANVALLEDSSVYNVAHAYADALDAEAGDAK